MPTRTVHLRPGVDDDLIEALEGESNASETMRQALRAWYSQQHEQSELLQELRATRKLLERGVSLAPQAPPSNSKDEIDGSALDGVLGGF